MGNWLSEPPCPKMTFQSDCCISVYAAPVSRIEQKTDKTMEEPPKKKARKESWTTQKSSRWCLTTTKFDKDLIDALTEGPWRRGACAIEIAEDGHEHLQAYVEQDWQCRASEIRDRYPDGSGGCRFMVKKAHKEYNTRVSLAYVLDKEEWHRWAKKNNVDHWSAQGKVVWEKDTSKFKPFNLTKEDTPSLTDIVCQRIKNGETLYDIDQDYPGFVFRHATQIKRYQMIQSEFKKGDKNVDRLLIKDDGYAFCDKHRR